MARAQGIQDKTTKLMDRAVTAVMDLIKDIERGQSEGATEDQLKAARELHRKAFWRLDYISAENSAGFHASQEAARILAEAIDYARQGQLALKQRKTPSTVAGAR